MKNKFYIKHWFFHIFTSPQFYAKLKPPSTVRLGAHQLSPLCSCKRLFLELTKTMYILNLGDEPDSAIWTEHIPTV